MPGEAWKLYDPTISDPVKFEFDTQAFRADMKKYTGIWLSVGKKCAGTYLDAAVALIYPFFIRTGNIAFRVIMCRWACPRLTTQAGAILIRRKAEVCFRAC